MCQQENRKAQRWKWFWWKDEFNFLNHISIEKSYIFQEEIYSIQLEKLRLMLNREVREGYVESELGAKAIQVTGTH